MLQQLSCDKDSSDNARSVALYIITTHLNGHTEEAWPSYQTLADATGKSVKTIQRAIRELEVNGWFAEIASGTTGSIVPQRRRFYGHRTPAKRRIKLSPFTPPKAVKIVRQGGQICPVKVDRYVHQTQREKNM
ncbi:DNA-binding transcriptional MocR family regulator [Pseudorhizobium tarimense]|uniref:DNA-binding transcriptional MocR family regulator n=1 Tax=Pseudorhizobium tarimense TaxID=1079109 RepID=A0ABV2H3R6_9HYPH|nr:helix-turn-helix domain-containing protein [Pseudorhizobium tarimense]MCJ8518491.1 helix-turn-helix domain-containing protein [Pseudorhizobium tarimense]